MSLTLRFHWPALDLEYLRKALPPSVEEEFFDYLRHLDTNDVVIHALKEGTIAFPRSGTAPFRTSIAMNCNDLAGVAEDLYSCLID